MSCYSVHRIDLERVVSSNVSHGREAEFIMMEYPLSFLLKGVDSNKQTSDLGFALTKFKIRCQITNQLFSFFQFKPNPSIKNSNNGLVTCFMSTRKLFKYRYSNVLEH